MKYSLYCFLFLWASGVLAQLPSPSSFNTAANGEMVGVADQHWQVAASPGGPFLPATVVGNCDGQWFASPPTANWVSLSTGNSCYQAGAGADYYFQRNMLLPPTNDCGLPIGGGFCLDMDFYADNCIQEVWVNGVGVYGATGSGGDCDNLQNVVRLALCDGWQAGPNTLTVHVKSTPPAIGLLAVARQPQSFAKDFLGRDTFLCSAKSYEITSPDSLTRWFDGRLGKTKTVTQPGRYWAARKDGNGCEHLDSVTVAFNSSFYVPNAFSPNADGFNDSFAPAFGGSLPAAYLLRIFDRWGGLVFESHDPALGWDGDQRGKPCNPGVYAYLIVAGGSGCQQAISGDLLLVR